MAGSAKSFQRFLDSSFFFFPSALERIGCAASRDKSQSNIHCLRREGCRLRDSSATLNTQPSIETHSLPALARCYPHSFTFSVANPIRSILNYFPSLGPAHRDGDAFPFRRQAGQIVGHSGEIAIDRNGMAALCVSRRIFQRRG